MRFSSRSFARTRRKDLKGSTGTKARVIHSVVTKLPSGWKSHWPQNAVPNPVSAKGISVSHGLEWLLFTRIHCDSYPLSEGNDPFKRGTTQADHCEIVYPERNGRGTEFRVGWEISREETKEAKDSRLVILGSHSSATPGVPKRFHFVPFVVFCSHLNCSVAHA